MVSRADQREHTCRKILDAAVAVFASQGFEGASTRTIAEAADVTQGLLTYHFPSKDELWRAAAERIFALVDEQVIQPTADLPSGTDAETGRESIKLYVRFVAEHPEMFQFMVDAQADPDGRSPWLVETYLRPLYEQFERRMVEFNPAVVAEQVPHVFYVMVGAGSAVFALKDEAMRLSGLDVASPASIEAHADLVARLLIP
jgi:TetR/AcrR family transcriptional regulator